MSRYRVVFGLPIKQVKNKLPLLRTQVKRYRSEGHPISGDSVLTSFHSGPQTKWNTWKFYCFGNVYTLFLPVKPRWLEGNSVSSFLLCSITGSFHTWEPHPASLRSGRFHNTWGQHSTVHTSRCDQTQVLPLYQLLTDKHRSAKHFLLNKLLRAKERGL